MPQRRPIASILSAPLLLALAACGSESTNGGAGNVAAGGFDPAAGDGQFVNGAALADEAAQAEALDTDLYGGSAAAGETDNSSTAQIPTHTPIPAPQKTEERAPATP